MSFNNVGGTDVKTSTQNGSDADHQQHVEERKTAC